MQKLQNASNSDFDFFTDWCVATPAFPKALSIVHCNE